MDAALRAEGGSGLHHASRQTLGLEAPKPSPHPVDGTELLDEFSTTSQSLPEDFYQREDRLWGEWGWAARGKPISPRLLRPFAVEPKQIRILDTSKKGYLPEDFMDAFARYLPTPKAKQSEQTS